MLFRSIRLMNWSIELASTTRDVVSVLTSRSRDAISNVSVSWKMREGLGLGLGLVSDWKSNVSVSSRSRTTRSRLQVDQYTFFIMFTLTLKRVQFYISFIQFIKHFPYARSLEGIVLTFYLFNEIRFTSLWSITTHLTSIMSSYLLNKMAEVQYNNGNDQNDYSIVIRFGYTNYKWRWRQQTVKMQGTD